MAPASAGADVPQSDARKVRRTKINNRRLMTDDAAMYLSIICLMSKKSISIKHILGLKALSRAAIADRARAIAMTTAKKADGRRDDASPTMTYPQSHARADGRYIKAIDI